MLKLKLLSILLFTIQLVNAEIFENRVFDSRVQTVLFGKAGTDDRYPIISLNSSEILKLSFDVLGPNSENLQYTFIHCDVNWKPTALNQNEYLSGLTLDNISDFKFSTNTYVKYVHYNILVPNDNMKPRIAGNYIVKVFRNYDEEDLLLTRRMMVMNNSTTIEGLARPASLAEYRFTKQEVIFSVGINPSQVVNPLDDIKIVLMQNSRWDNAITDLKPQFMSNNKLEYSYLDKSLFNGGNEFRFFDIRNLRQFSTNVRSKRTDSVIHVILNIDESRGANQYFNYIDYNGKRLIQNKEGNNSDIDGDYAYVNFYLSSTMGVPPDAEVYVFGEFTDWRLDPAYKMYYNKSRQRYDLEIPMKQGRFEYCYAIKNENGKAEETSLEGNHFQTENEYMILVYTKNLQFHYEELIGARKFSTQTP
ncbi:MAG: DUF5103 domain-containing protein [Bacteroidia bacterium]|nr:DUF5103 domain-containing protein [Bacteroidia bacterium]MCF8425345.1 DUF5103 domain-containing protein [Bacteroidia bacterium]MCF8446872.1 DUF5103 domain-containing protein [Bacteroidia bacterium]